MSAVNSFGAKDTLHVGDKSYEIFRLDTVPGHEKLPFSLKVLLENLLRTEDGANVTKEQIEALGSWVPTAEPDTEIQFTPARVVMQDFTGVPCIVDLATMREAVVALGGDPNRINPLSPAEMVIDHSVIADLFGTENALERNVEIEYERNGERYQFLRWGQTAFDDFKVVPPGTGIVHQVNIEHLAKVIYDRDVNGVTRAYPDTCVGTDSHTTMVNGLGVLGWGVGGIEAEAAMLGQPVSMLIPKVVGFKLSGAIPTGVTATDVVLTITDMLRKHGVVGKFVEFYGTGVASVPLANRATIGNMSPEFGSTAAMFPIDDVTIDYLRLTGRSEAQLALVEQYAKLQKLWHDPADEAVYSEYLELDLSTVVPSIAGPKRPQDRIVLANAKAQFEADLTDYAEVDHDLVDLEGAESFPASDPPGNSPEDEHSQHLHHHHSHAPKTASKPTPVELADGTSYTLDHGAVTIAAITSCTNTSNPSVMLAAGLLARNAVKKGLKAKPWVKTTLAPGSKVVTDYYEKAGLTQDLEDLGFYTVGYGCTTCIGNSGPLIEEVSAAVQQNDLAVTAVLSGNRNFEGRINPDVKMNYLASPPLVIAYSLAGSMNFDFETDPLGQDGDGNDVFLKDIWPDTAEVQSTIDSSINKDMFTNQYASVFEGDERWRTLPTPTGATFEWDAESTYVRKPPYFDGMTMATTPVTDIVGRPGAREARRLGHDRPHQPGRQHQGRQPRGPVPHRARRRPQGLQLLRIAPRQPRGDDPRHLREHPPEEPAPRRRRGRLHPRLHPGRRPAVVHLRREPELPGRRYPARHLRRQGVRLGLVPRLGGEGHEPPGREGGHHRELRAHPPVEPHRHGRRAAAVPGRRVGRLARPRRHRGRLDLGPRAAERGRHAEDGARRGRAERALARRKADRRVRRGRAHRHARRGGLLPQRRHPAVRPPLARLTRRTRSGRSA